MIAAVADTHAVIWYLASDTRLSPTVLHFMNAAAEQGDQIAISAISLVEMVYLIEKGRIPAERFSELARELDTPGSIFLETAVHLSIARSLTRVDVLQIPDLPDRVIAATALNLGVPLISRDGKIRVSSVETIW